MTRPMVLTWTLLACFAGAPGSAAPVDFATQIRPIFAEACYKCHGPEKDKADLTMHTRAALEKGGETGDTLVAGKPDASELFVRISLPADDDDIMPPKGDPLTKDQIALVKQWIAEGAKFGDWKEDLEAIKALSKGPKLPTVPEADPKAIGKLESLGALAMPLARDTNLLNVDFRAEAPNIGDSHLVHLKPVAQQIVWLNLAGTQVTDDGLAALADLPNLRMLHLEKTAISDAGLAHVIKCAELTYLNLYGTKITDAGLGQIASLKKLQKLYLWQTAVTDAGVKALKAALPDLMIDTGYNPPKPEEKPAEAKPDDKKMPDKAAAAAADKDKPAVTFASLASKFKADSCCDKAAKAGKDKCGHPCCVQALGKGEVCTKCNG